MSSLLCVYLFYLYTLHDYGIDDNLMKVNNVVGRPTKKSVDLQEIN